MEQLIQKWDFIKFAFALNCDLYISLKICIFVQNKIYIEYKNFATNFQWKRKTREKNEDFRCLLEVIAVYNQQKRSALVNFIDVMVTNVAQLVCFIATINFNNSTHASLYFCCDLLIFSMCTYINKIISLLISCLI